MRHCPFMDMKNTMPKIGCYGLSSGIGGSFIICRTTWSAICLRGRINHGNSSARSTRRCLKSYGASDMITLVFCAASLLMVPDISILFCPYGCEAHCIKNYHLLKERYDYYPGSVAH